MYGPVANDVPACRLRQAKSCCPYDWQLLWQRLHQICWGSLRAKCILVIVSLVVALLAAVTLIQEGNQRQAVLEQARLRALAIGSSLVALSEGYLTSYNFAKLEQVTENVTNSEEDVVYAVAHVRDGTVAAFSGRNDLQGKMLPDQLSQRAVQTKYPLVQSITLPGSQEPGYDVAIPVYLPGSSQKWGTMRLGFSLKSAYMTIRNSRRDLFILGLAATCGSTVLAVLLATRISRPVGHLVAAVHELARGAYDRPVPVHGQDEIGYLASAFEGMRCSLQAHLAGLAEEKLHLQEANLRLKETQQQTIHLAARVAHEVNNPLAIVKTAIRIIRKQSQKDDLADTNLEVIEEEINRVSRIIQDLLAFSRPIRPDQSVELNTVLRGLQGLLECSLRDKQIALHLQLEPDLPQVPLSADHLKQVVLNIVRNAEDAMAAGGTLLMQTARHEKGVELSITDTGCGISAEYLEHLFDPFFTTKESERGMGLGLAVSFGIIRRANGNITVESEVGSGTTFRIVLPEALTMLAEGQEPDGGREG
ncbi:MAG: ATP-binding protein [Candidatus Tectimicrobiota bacterium]